MKEWRKPELSVMGLMMTNEEVSPYDLGHGYDKYNHTHHCSCGLEFETWAEAMEHELTMTEDGKSEFHNIGCNIISRIS